MSKKPTYEELEKRVKQLEKAESERNQAEEVLHKSEEKYRGIFDESIAAVYVFDEKKYFIDSNQAGLDLLGYSRDELLSLSIPDVDADPVVVLPAHKQLLSGENIVNYEHQLRRKDGMIITVLNNSRPLTDTEGDIIGMQSTLIDITDRKQAEEELKNYRNHLEELVAERTSDLRKSNEELQREITERKKTEEALKESEERYRSLFKNNHSVMLLIDPKNADIIDANPAAISYYGWSLDELTAKKITDINMLTEEQVFQEMQKAKSEQRRNFFFRHRLSNGDIRDVEVYSGPIKLHGHKFLYSIIHDITDRKQAEEEREKLINELQEALKEIKTLRGILPLCSFCKKIRDDKGYWEQVDVYIHKHSQADISHSICPECAKEHYPDLDIHE